MELRSEVLSEPEDWESNSSSGLVSTAMCAVASVIVTADGEDENIPAGYSTEVGRVFVVLLRTSGQVER